MSKYPHIEGTTDEEILYQHLSDYALQTINYILEAYASGKIDFIEPRTPDGEPDFEGSYELVKNDSSYVETGCELLFMKWIESNEYTGYLIECMQDIQYKYLVAYIKDDFAQTIIVNADSPKTAEQHILSDPDCFVYKVSPLTVAQYERFKHLREVIAA